MNANRGDATTRPRAAGSPRHAARIDGAVGEVPTTMLERREHDGVTMFEVFFDLVFVFALMRVVELMESQPGPAGLGRGTLLLLLLWWAWCAYIWLGNRVRLDRGVVVIATLAAMGALFVAALVIPHAWDPHPGWWSPALVLAIAFTVVRAGYIATFLWSSRGDRALRTQVLIDAMLQTASSVLLFAGAVLGGELQSLCWAVAFGLDFGVGWLVAHFNGWRVASPAHFVERHGLVLIIALGETVLSSGAGLTSKLREGSVSGLSIPAGLLAFVIVVGLWWAYFRGPSPAAQHALVRATPQRRPALARDGYTIGHFPLVTGVVYVALGARLLLEDVAVAPGAPARGFAVVALAAGLACSLLGLGVFARLMTGRWSVPSLGAGVAAIVLGAASAGLPSLTVLAVFTGLVSIAAIAIAWRVRVRQAETSGRRR